MRVVSLLPSATEITWALGRGSDLVGRSEECDYPPEVRGLPVVMRARTLDGDRPSAEIDARVRASIGSGESLYELDLARLAELHPDLLLTQDLCRVCSVTDDEVRAGCARAGVAPRIVSLAPTRLEEVWRSIEEVGRALAVPEDGARLAGMLRERARPRPPVAPEVKVAIVEWLDPPILAGLWAGDIVRAAGALYLGPAVGRPAERTSWEALRTARPDLVVVSPCSFSVGRTRREIESSSTLRDAVGRLIAAKGVWLADEAYFSRPGPRLAEGVELIASLTNGVRPAAPRPVARWSPRVEVAG